MIILKTSDTHKGLSLTTTGIHDKWAKKFQKEEWDLIVLAGDIASDRKAHFESALRWWRRQAGDKPILLTRGNHDLWDKSQKNLESLRNKLHHEWFQEYNIHHLESMGPYVKDDVTFVGWDGWYGWRDAGHTNDLKHMRAYVQGDTWGWLQKEAMIAFDKATEDARIAKESGQKVVAVTHFPIIEGLTRDAYSGNFSYWEFLNQNIDMFMYGHSHKGVDQVVDGVRVINSGSDYQKPKHIVVTI